MPSPVEFNVSMGTIPPNFTGGTQALANLIASLLRISPNQDWNSFVVSSALPTSNVGPALKDGREWYVWDQSSGAYVPLTINGTAMTTATLPLSALAAVTPYAALVSSSTGAVAAAAGSSGQVLTSNGTASAPSFKAPLTGNNFSVTKNADQLYNSDGSTVLVVFDTVVSSAGLTFDTANSRFTCVEAGTYFFGASFQVDQRNGSWTQVQRVGLIAVNSSASPNSVTDVVGTETGRRTSVRPSGVFVLAAGDHVYCYVSTIHLAGEATANSFCVEANQQGTRFFGVRLS
jgi:hypothetical protein